jgi:uncharacterized protein (DUF2236 family)
MSAPAPTLPHTGGDPGYFGPDSVTWVLGDPAMAVAGLRTLLLQALHPLAMHGVAAHSDFQADPWGRLMRTGEFVGVVTFGSRAEADRAAAAVRGIHRRISQRPTVEPETGLSYRVDDPELLRWVHVTELESFLSTTRRCGLALTNAEADRYVAEQVVAARLVGIDPAVTPVPANVAEVAAYLDAMRPQLRATAAARRTALFGFLPPMPPWVALATPAVPAWAGLTSLAFAMLPRWARRLYGAPGLPTTDAAATAAGRALRRSLLAVPPTLREGPHRKAARARLER